MCCWTSRGPVDRWEDLRRQMEPVDNSSNIDGNNSSNTIGNKQRNNDRAAIRTPSPTDGRR